MVQRITIADGATSGTVTTVPASDDVYVGGDMASATITDATGGNWREPGKTNSNDDLINGCTRRDHSERNSGCAGVTEGRREHHLHGETPGRTCGWRGDGDAGNGATITIADGATSGTTTVPASDDVLRPRRRRYGFRDYH
ncbi:hypothetical protein OK016_19290 [Vibrio chagasii]|nr:hypothetical protein [Vibrio chagasii]